MMSQAVSVGRVVEVVVDAEEDVRRREMEDEPAAEGEQMRLDGHGDRIADAHVAAQKAPSIDPVAAAETIRILVYPARLDGRCWIWPT